jgi:catechol 2,3-dioxygenase-like lactoylglutathione lyase family enzyme
MIMLSPEFIGVELYFDDLERARRFYTAVLGLQIADEDPGHHVKFDSANGFICCESKGAESYPSRDKAVLFFEVDNLAATVAELGGERFVQVEPNWAVLHDPEGHNVLLLQKG